MLVFRRMHGSVSQPSKTGLTVGTQTAAGGSRSTATWVRALVSAAGLALLVPILAVAVLVHTASGSAAPVLDRQATTPKGSPALKATPVALFTNGEWDRLGSSIAVAGDSALIGAPLNMSGSEWGWGAAYGFGRTGATWFQRSKLAPDGRSPWDEFGDSVALDGETAVVGAPFTKVGTNSHQGAAYVFSHAGGGWTFQAMLTAGDGGRSDLFGCSVAVSGDVLLVGARQHWTSESARGAVYVFTRSGAGWAQQSKLFIEGGEDGFGFSVALAGDTALVGAPYYDGGHGAAFVYERSNSTWRQRALLTCGEQSGWAGWAVALDGNTAVLGAPNAYGDEQAGAAYVFTRSGSTWLGPAMLCAPVGASGDLFGASVAVSDNAIVVGAPDTDVGGASDVGAAWVFVGKGTCWSKHAGLPFSGASGSKFGRGVALLGPTAFAGAPGDNDAQAIHSSARVFALTGMVPDKPHVARLGQAKIKRGKWLSIYGSAMGEPRGTGYVKFGTAKSKTCSAWREEYICCKVPATAKKGRLKVCVVNATGTSNWKYVTVK